ncbi:MAG TPA: TIM barrel protein [Terriglobia bacterium]|nr:TIM barrel protein [Terriglobia bacterium]
MNRRDFTRNVAGAALGAAALGTNRAGAASGLGGSAAAAGGREAPGVPFTLSVMLWTVFQRLPFEQRLEKVSEAGYKNVELVGEYRHWSESDFSKANTKRRELGITFDTTAGLAHGVGDPGARDALLADLRHELPIMEKIECPAVIIMSGNVVPGMQRAQQHQSCIDGLKRAAELVDGKEIAGQKVRLLLENIDPEENSKYYLTSVAEGFDIIKAVNHPQVKFLYDFFHEQIAEGNLIEKLEKNINEVGLVHIADVPGRHEPGTGEINYENIFKTLGRLKYDRYAAMEFLPTSNPVGKLRAAREMALQAGRVS